MKPYQSGIDVVIEVIQITLAGFLLGAVATLLGLYFFS